MSLREPSAEALERGRWAEEKERLRLVDEYEKGRVLWFCRPEWIVYETEGPHFVEVKGQEAFEPPPFKGHGLPLRQVRTYEHLRVLTGWRTRLIVHDPSGYRYSAWLDELETGPHFDTGVSMRRIYPLELFEVEEE